MKTFSLLIGLLFSTAIITFGQNKGKTYLLVHGAWHGAWCWDKVVPAMAAKGCNVIAIDLPGHGKDNTNPDNITLADYVGKVKEVATGIEGPVILVGHSMGGIVISQAAEDLGVKKVKKLIYLDAFIPRNGESVSSLARLIESTLPKDSTRISIGNGLVVSESKKTSTFKPDIADLLFYHDCQPEDKAFAHLHLGRQAFAPLSTPVSVSENTYGHIPKFYILCTESKDLDKSILPTRVHCEKVIRIKSGHSPFFSMPQQLATILLQL